MAPEPDVNYNIKRERMQRERAGICMDMFPTKVQNSESRKCCVCGGQTQFFCDSGRCKVWACFYGRGLHGNPMETCMGKIHARYRKARKKLRRDLWSSKFYSRTCKYCSSNWFFTVKYICDPIRSRICLACIIWYTVLNYIVSIIPNLFVSISSFPTFLCQHRFFL